MNRFIVTAAATMAFLMPFLPSAVPAWAEGSVEYKYLAPVPGELRKGSYYAVPVPAEVLKICRVGCADLRVFSPDGVEVPYVMVERRQPAQSVITYPMEVTGFDATGDTVTVTAELPEEHGTVEKITIETAARDFEKTITVYGSNDGGSSDGGNSGGDGWEKLAEGTLYDYHSKVDLRKSYIKFPESRHRYYRIVIKDRDGGDKAGEGAGSLEIKYDGLDLKVNNDKARSFRITRLRAHSKADDDDSVNYDSITFTDPNTLSTVTYEDGDTAITLDASLPAARLRFIVADTYYHRKVSVYTADNNSDDSYRYIGEGDIVAFPLVGEEEDRHTIRVSSPKSRYYRLKVENKDNEPLQVSAVDLEWVQRMAVFVATDDSAGYHLYFGGSETIKKPRYDLARFVGQSNWHERSPTILAAGGVAENIDYDPAPSDDRYEGLERAILTVVVIVLVIAIGVWLYTLVKRGGKEAAGTDDAKPDESANSSTPPSNDATEETGNKGGKDG